MNLCSDGHAEVCYEDRHCPACELASSKDDEIETLRERVRELEAEVEQLASQE